MAEAGEDGWTVGADDCEVDEAVLAREECGMIVSRVFVSVVLEARAVGVDMWRRSSDSAVNE